MSRRRWHQIVGGYTQNQEIMRMLKTGSGAPVVRGYRYCEVTKGEPRARVCMRVHRETMSNYPGGVCKGECLFPRDGNKDFRREVLSNNRPDFISPGERW
ncbi:MAG: hypothetical protein UT63_C0072G0010 [Candidatus Gottesmanbacteria bacterium GW2011_GWC2_39_8]|uniref:Uncharacterized protein n=1 Tax=Candidatus Gottesmanbacteria bacterium GW2011_GWC2_39_8 TaxID=1618450 RepID=A0A0G0PT85_9BACT|nr:MAG: hypothetical protein UT63_C0072G0010 [Candidatus Gottesmanbacteria bacterium GW2011_GWC2_39_8]